jgi:hypothetical protein
VSVVRRVDPALATEVAASFAAGPDTPRDPLVVAAFNQLGQQSDLMFSRLTDPALRHPIRIVFTRHRETYRTAWEMIGAVRAERLLEVTTAATQDNARHPLMNCDRGGTFDRFRAVHDIVGHAWPCLGFDRDGEYAAWLTQDRFYHGLARRALATELHGKHSVLWTTGVVAEHKAILLDRDLLRRSRKARGTAVPAH